MVAISYWTALVVIGTLWLLIRGFASIRNGAVIWRREVQLLLVLICICVVARFTFFPFGKVDGRIQPLLFDLSRLLQPRVNFVPFVHLFDYPDKREAILNFVGNTAMFLPIGIVWPAVFKNLNTHGKVLGAGIGFSLCIEILQLPFFDRVTDIDDLILNSVGFAAGYGILLLCRLAAKRKNR